MRRPPQERSCLPPECFPSRPLRSQVQWRLFRVWIWPGSVLMEAPGVADRNPVGPFPGVLRRLLNPSPIPSSCPSPCLQTGLCVRFARSGSSGCSSQPALSRLAKKSNHRRFRFNSRGLPQTSQSLACCSPDSPASVGVLPQIDPTKSENNSRSRCSSRAVPSSQGRDWFAALAFGPLPVSLLFAIQPTGFSK